MVVGPVLGVALVVLGLALEILGEVLVIWSKVKPPSLGRVVLGVVLVVLGADASPVWKKVMKKKKMFGIPQS